MATGQALYALAFADPTMVSGSVLDAQAYLIAEQQDNGSWVVASTLAENDLAVTDVSIEWGTAWAAIGLARSAVPEPHWLLQQAAGIGVLSALARRRSRRAGPAPEATLAPHSATP